MHVQRATVISDILLRCTAASFVPHMQIHMQCLTTSSLRHILYGINKYKHLNKSLYVRLGDQRQISMPLFST